MNVSNLTFESLNNPPYRYYYINPTATQLYPSLEAVIDNKGDNGGMLAFIA